MMVLPAFGQEFSIDGTVSGLSNGDVYLIRISGDNRRVIDTARTDMTGAFTFNLDADTDIGQYGVLVGPGQLVELLYNKEHIRFITSGGSRDSQVQIIESIENLIYYDYLKVKGTNLYKLDLLYPLLQYYPKDDEFYLETLAKVRLLQEQITQRFERIDQQQPRNAFCQRNSRRSTRLCRSHASEKEQELYLKSNYFNDEDFLGYFAA